MVNHPGWALLVRSTSGSDLDSVIMMLILTHCIHYACVLLMTDSL